MSSFLLNLLLSAVWAFLRGETNLENLAFGFALGYAILAWLRPLPGSAKYSSRLPLSLLLLAFFLWELIVSSFRVARDVISPTARTRPGIVGVPLDATTDAEITLLTCLITLTPGTLGLDVSSDRQTLYVHSMWVDDPEQVRREIKEGFERRVLELMR